jgi:hypothetical protein
VGRLAVAGAGQQGSGGLRLCPAAVLLSSASLMPSELGAGVSQGCLALRKEALEALEERPVLQNGGPMAAGWGVADMLLLIWRAASVERLATRTFGPDSCEEFWVRGAGSQVPDLVGMAERAGALQLFAIGVVLEQPDLQEPAWFVSGQAQVHTGVQAGERRSTRCGAVMDLCPPTPSHAAQLWHVSDIMLGFVA